MKTIRPCTATTCLFSTTLLFGLILSSSLTSATNDSVVDEINITVPISCTLTGTGMNTHNAEIANGTYTADIGTTTLKAFCNDAEGFAIYAAGYTGNEIGGTNSNKLVGTSASNNATIETGLAISAGNPDTSNWAMKLALTGDSGDTTGTNAAVIDSAPNVLNGEAASFSSYHVVPNEYTKVAHKNSATSMDTTTGGVTLTTTYAAYISKTQIADTYSGQVIYTLVHPGYVDNSAMRDAVTVVFDGNGLTFPNGSTTNTVKYTNAYKPGDMIYVANTPYTTVGTSNLNSDGTQKSNSPSYTDSENILQTITVPNADKVKVVVDYGTTGDTGAMTIVQGVWGGWEESSPTEDYLDIYDSENSQGQQSFLFDGDTITIATESWDVPESGYDYGFYAKVYPAYDTEQANTTPEELPSHDYSILPISGAYLETTEWSGKWVANINNAEIVFQDTEAYCEEAQCHEAMSAKQNLQNYILNNYYSIKGTTITLYAFNPVTFDEVYQAANKSKTNGYYAIHDLNSSMCDEVTVGELTDVIDIRDNNIYSIGKLSDGNCWLRENLRLDPTNSTVASNMSATNTHATSEALYNYLHGGNPENNTNWTSTAVSSPNDWPNNDNLNPYINVSNNTLYGVYYNYCAATVGTICSDATNIGVNYSSYDVCPANWSLPSTEEVYASSLSPSVRTLGLVNSGFYSGGTITDETDHMSYVGYYGFYWTTHCNLSRAVNVFRANYTNNSIESVSGMGTYRHAGDTIRCILSTGE